MLQRVKSRFLSKFFCLNAEKFFRGTILCCVSENFRKRKSLCIRGRGKCPVSPSKIFGLTVPEKFVGQPFRVSLISVIEKVFASEGYVMTAVEIFCLTEPKYYVGNPAVLCFRKIASAKNFMDNRGVGVSRFSAENFCFTVPKNAVNEPFSHSLISGIEKVWIRGRGKCPDSPSKISCLTVPKNS